MWGLFRQAVQFPPSPSWNPTIQIADFLSNFSLNSAFTLSSHRYVCIRYDIAFPCPKGLFSLNPNTTYLIGTIQEASLLRSGTDRILPNCHLPWTIQNQYDHIDIRREHSLSRLGIVLLGNCVTDEDVQFWQNSYAVGLCKISRWLRIFTFSKFDKRSLHSDLHEPGWTYFIVLA